MDSQEIERGKLIVFEGIDGSGKSTQVAMLASSLREKFGIDVVTGFEPTNGVYGAAVRAAAGKNESLGVNEIPYLLLDRAEHAACINKVSEGGKWYLLDRYYLSMMAYQGAGGCDVEAIRSINELIAPIPDIAFLMDISVTEAMRRIKQRGIGTTLFETEAFLESCRSIYAGMDMPWLHRVAADRDAESIHADILAKIVSTFNLYGTSNNETGPVRA